MMMIYILNAIPNEIPMARVSRSFHMSMYMVRFGCLSVYVQISLEVIAVSCCGFSGGFGMQSVSIAHS